MLAGFASKSGCLVGVSCSLERKEKVKKSGILRYRKESDRRYGGSSRDTPKKTQKKVKNSEKTDKKLKKKTKNTKGQRKNTKRQAKNSNKEARNSK